MKSLMVKNYNKFRLFDYENQSNRTFRLGEILLHKEQKEIGVVIQLHGDEDCRTDMFGNCSLSEVKYATKKEIEKYRPDLLPELK